MKKNRSIRDWLSHQDFTLALSSSFFGFYAHCGLVTAFYENGLVPKKITGSSAGALVAGALGSGMKPNELRDLFFSMQKKDFWDPKFGLGLLKGDKFLSILRKHLVQDFSHTKMPVEMAVFDLGKLKTKFIKSGDLPKAIVASCAVPFMFHPVKIEGSLCIDGGVFLKSGMNLENKSERILCAFFQNSGLVGAYEWKSTFKGLSQQQKIMRFQGLPAVHPNSMHSGRDAYEAAYRRTCIALLEPIPEDSLIEVK